mmetsp:Transcript_6815/g.16578  ORF Transcript_6815/g.16578 Transcript_6815/m.16578 type:complete len:555 (+) Transcript_6815:1-1665(+)
MQYMFGESGDESGSDDGEMEFEYVFEEEGSSDEEDAADDQSFAGNQYAPRANKNSEEGEMEVIFQGSGQHNRARASSGSSLVMKKTQRSPPDVPDMASTPSSSSSSILHTNDPDWLFFDTINIYVEGGLGGDGCMAMRHEKDDPRGGPCGGNGGHGGSIYLKATASRNTLSRFGSGVHFRAPKGQTGMGKSRHGIQGTDITLDVPLGTVVRDRDTGVVLGDLDTDGEILLAARGGRGGRGNEAFKTARNVSPRLSERGEPPDARWLRLELKLLADAGLVGAPNAGKSTFLAAVSNARPKIADYPFTTVVPNLGVVKLYDDAINLLDIPGLLEGAHDGVGLGIAFLRHIERCRVIIFIVSGDSNDPWGDYHAVTQELELFNPSILERPQIVLINKIDLPHVREKIPELEKQFAERLPHKRLAFVSAVTGENISKVMPRIFKLVAKTDAPIINHGPVEDDADRKLRQKRFRVEKLTDTQFQVYGHELERLVLMTNWDYEEAQDRFARILEAMNVNLALDKAGAKRGATVYIGDFDFEYDPQVNEYARAAIEDGYLD